MSCAGEQKWLAQSENEWVWDWVVALLPFFILLQSGVLSASAIVHASQISQTCAILQVGIGPVLTHCHAKRVGAHLSIPLPPQVLAVSWRWVRGPET